ncbi:5-formyltetrahydrofolate cyclo-ligase [Alteribacter keqinensis]|uniref:5-formyltetrahydrofolate cyclo-ligase n=1 Tax=Alteribacter keqinensis TaxID=2483800 RepID=A0A3M7TU07_9BACI|nr:5-formyltetrahydrofolate cyclo-ligase [Alteribacter keqinensis]RNA68923.1 5-formyltetrahydrofolate cyclo-ligase [Alteribacter keqinensis]
MEAKEVKRLMRNEVKHHLSKEDPEDLALKTSKIHNILFEQPEWKRAGNVGITLSVGREIDTYEILARGLEENKQMAAPKCDPDKKTLIFYHITSLEQLEDSFYGLKEPDLLKCKKVNEDDLDFLLVPGIVYSDKGYRIGYGGGYYDRFLSGNPSLYTCSLAYEIQLRDNLPTEEHDIAVKSIITEKRFIRP